MGMPKIEVKEVRRVDEFGCVDWYYYPIVHTPLGPEELTAQNSASSARDYAEQWVRLKRAACP